MILIGSKAILTHFPDFNRIPKDTDYIVKEVPKIKEENTEYLLNPVFNNYPNGVMLPNDLYTLKISHLVHSDINFNKHLYDVQFLKNKGCKIDLELFHRLYSYWDFVHGINKRSNLELSSSEFFNNRIDYPIPHDEIHEILLTHPYFEDQREPTYKKVLKHGAEVAISEEKFLSLTHKEKINLVVEENLAMSAERDFHKNWKVNYARMLKKFIISHCILLEAIFIIENYPELEKCPFNYKEFLNNKIKEYGLQEIKQCA